MATPVRASILVRGTPSPPTWINSLEDSLEDSPAPASATPPPTTLHRSASRRSVRSVRFSGTDLVDLADERTPLIAAAGSDGGSGGGGGGSSGGGSTFSRQRRRLIRSASGVMFPEPEDRWKVVGLIFFYLGMSTMLPWNFLVTITSFWNYKFRNVTLDGHTMLNGTSATPTSPMVGVANMTTPTEMQLSFPSYLAIASNVPGAMTTLLHSLAGQRISVTSRIMWSLSVMLGAFVAFLGLSIPNCDLWQARFLHAVIMIVVLTNVGVNVLQGALFGVSGRFPPLYAGCVMSGQAFGGVLPALAAIGLITMQVEPKVLGPACFIAIIGFLGLAIAAYAVLTHNQFFLYYGEGKRTEESFVNHDEEVDKLCYKEIFRKSWPYFFAGYINYATTLCIYPGLTSLVMPQHETEWAVKYFTPVCSVLLMNTGDLIGRSLATWLQWPGRRRIEQYGLLAFAILRIGLVVLVMLCNASPDFRHYLPVLIHSDLVFCGLVLFMSVTNGYIGNLCMLQAPLLVRPPPEKEAVSILVNMFMVYGIASGSLASLFVRMVL